jgi:hypothetical protein
MNFFLLGVLPVKMIARGWTTVKHGYGAGIRIRTVVSVSLLRIEKYNFLMKFFNVIFA